MTFAEYKTGVRYFDAETWESLTSKEKREARADWTKHYKDEYASLDEFYDWEEFMAESSVPPWFNNPLKGILSDSDAYELLYD